VTSTAAPQLDAAELDGEPAAAGGTSVDPDYLLNAMIICKLVYGPDGSPKDWLYLYVNRVWEEHSGRGPFRGRLGSEVFPGIHELDPDILRKLARVAAGGPPERFIIYLKSIGDWFEVQAHSRKRGYFVAVFDVITERVEREHRLKQAQARLSLAQQLSRSGVWDWDIASGTLYWTPEMINLLGLDPAETVPTFDIWHRAVHPDDIELAGARLNSAVQMRTPFFSEYRVIRPDGQLRWIRAYGDTLYDDEGQPHRMLGLCIDVTDLKQLSQQAAEADAANLAKNTFLATMSHELRTPLNSIIGFTSLILDGLTGDLNEEQARQLTIVKRSGQQLLDLISEILDIAKVEAGRLTVELATVPLEDILSEQCEALRPIAQGRGLALLPLECEEDLLVRADARRLSQVVRNLLANAAKFTDGGSIRVSARRLGSNAQVDIMDTGIGIAAEDIERIFTPFRRSADPRSAFRAGTGLGLSISRSLMLAMSGDISVTSEIGRGSTFSITVSLAD
jgi:PAS domain S-box-containing protein